MEIFESFAKVVEQLIREVIVLEILGNVKDCNGVPAINTAGSVSAGATGKTGNNSSSSPKDIISFGASSFFKEICDELREHNFLPLCHVHGGEHRHGEHGAGGHATDGYMQFQPDPHNPHLDPAGSAGDPDSHAHHHHHVEGSGCHRHNNPRSVYAVPLFQDPHQRHRAKVKKIACDYHSEYKLKRMLHKVGTYYDYGVLRESVLLEQTRRLME